MIVTLLSLNRLTQIVEPFVCDYEMKHVLKNHKEVTKMIDYIFPKIANSTRAHDFTHLETIDREDVVKAVARCGYVEKKILRSAQ